MLRPTRVYVCLNLGTHICPNIGLSDRQTDRQTDIQTDRQTDRHIDRQTEAYSLIQIDIGYKSTNIHKTDRY